MITDADVERKRARIENLAKEAESIHAAIVSGEAATGDIEVDRTRVVRQTARATAFREALHILMYT